MTIETIAISFSGVVLLALLRVTIQNRDSIMAQHQALFGPPGASHLGIVDRLKTLGDTLERHCTDEREFWDEVKNQRETIKAEVVNAATAVIGEAQLLFGERIDELAKQVETLAERRGNPRT